MCFGLNDLSERNPCSIFRNKFLNKDNFLQLYTYVHVSFKYEFDHII